MHQTVEPCPGGLIDGAVLEVSKKELRLCDECEPVEYKRRKVPLQSGILAWLYFKTGAPKPALPSLDQERQLARGRDERYWQTPLVLAWQTTSPRCAGILRVWTICSATFAPEPCQHQTGP